MGPGKFQTLCASLGQFLRQFSYRGQSGLPTTRNWVVVDHLLPVFSEDALGKSKWPIRDGFPGEGGRPTAHHRLKIPQTSPPLRWGLSRDQSGGRDGETPGRALTARIQGGVRGWRRGLTGGAPRDHWGRVNSGACRARSASFCGNSRTGVRLRCQRREAGAVVFTWAIFFAAGRTQVSRPPEGGLPKFPKGPTVPA